MQCPGEEVGRAVTGAARTATTRSTTQAPRRCAPIACAASINPRSTSHKLTSTMRAKNAIAACGANHHRGQQSASLRTDFRKESAKSDLDEKAPGALSRDPAFITASMSLASRLPLRHLLR